MKRNTYMTYHILLITPGFPDSEADTVCIPSLQDMLRGFSRSHSGFKFSVIALHYPFHKTPYTWHGIQVFPLNSSARSLLFRWPDWMQFAKLVSRIQKRDPIHLIHCFWYNETAFLGSWAAQFLKTPVLTTIMGQELRERNPYLDLIQRKKHTTVAVSTYQKQDIESKNPGFKVQKVIPWGIPYESFRAKKTTKSVDLLGVGGMTRLKNFDMFIDLMKEGVKTHPEIKGILAGKGPESSRIEKRIQAEGLTNHLTYMREVSREKVQELMGQSRILVHPSRFESFGMVFLEALAAGMTIVSFNTGIAAPSDKWQVAKDPQDFNKKVHKCLGEQLDPTPRPLFHIDNTAHAYKALYEQLLA